MRTFALSAFAALTVSGCATVNDSIVGMMDSERMCYLLGSPEPTIPGSRDAMRRELARRGVQCVIEAASPTPTNRGVSLGRSAIERLRAHDWEAAVRDAGAAIATGELNQDQLAAMFLLRAYAYWNLGQREVAKRELQLAFEVRPGLAAARRLRDEFAMKERTESQRRPARERATPKTDEISPPIIQF